ncbi:MAG: hypothetical protein ACR2H5_02635 [Ktedonobacteraceae bacterium]
MIDNWGFEDDDLGKNEEKKIRLNAEWSTLVALRDMRGIANKGSRTNSASYKQALLLGEALIPGLFDPQHSLLNRERLSETARRFIQIAEASSESEGKTISPIDLLEIEINKLAKLLTKESFSIDVDLIRKSMNDMRKAVEELRERKNTEHSLIFRDAYQVERKFPISGNGRNYREFEISKDRALRVRVLHPDKPEYATGTDLIYENYWEAGKVKLVRIAALQYKVWHNKSLYLDKRIQGQLEKMEKTYCGGNFCLEDSKYKIKYRLPCCAAFLRPTDELQSSNSSFLSGGCYVPICVVRNAQQSTAKGNNVLRSKDIRSQAVTHKIFEEMFNSNMIGSRWLTYKELEDLYLANKILESDEQIIIHAQELPLN